MMKHLFLAVSAFFLSATLAAQTLHVYRGAVEVAIPAVQVGTVHGGSTETMTIAGVTYKLAEVDSMTVDNAVVQPATVHVRYDGATARVLISGDVAPYLTASVTGGDVILTADSLFSTEVAYELSGQGTGSFTHYGRFKSTVRFNGLNLTSTNGAAVDIQNGKRINVLLVDGTQNVLVDGAGGMQKACFYVDGHAEFSGAGVLTLFGNTHHAYASNEYTELQDDFTGTINVKGAVGDGMHVEQYYMQRGGNVNISGCQGDGLDVSVKKNPLDTLNGQTLIAAGSISIELGAADDVKGLKSDSLITISGGSINITGAGDGQKGIRSTNDLIINAGSGAAPAIAIRLTGTTYHKGQLDESKTRGIKVNRNFRMEGGVVQVTTTGDKAKPCVVDGTYYYRGGSINCPVDALKVG